VTLAHPEDLLAAPVQALSLSRRQLAKEGDGRGEELLLFRGPKNARLRFVHGKDENRFWTFSAAAVAVAVAAAVAADAAVDADGRQRFRRPAEAIVFDHISWKTGRARDVGGGGGAKLLARDEARTKETSADDLVSSFLRLEVEAEAEVG